MILNHWPAVLIHDTKIPLNSTFFLDVIFLNHHNKGQASRTGVWTQMGLWFEGKPDLELSIGEEYFLILHTGKTLLFPEENALALSLLQQESNKASAGTRSE